MTDLIEPVVVANAAPEPVGVSLPVGIVLSSDTVSNIIEILKTLNVLNTPELLLAYHNAKWLDVGFITIEDALTVASPFFSEANMIIPILKFVNALVDNIPMVPGQPFNFQTFMIGLAKVALIDWNSILTEINKKEYVTAGLTVADDLIRLLSPYITPYGIPADILLRILIWVVSTQEGQPEPEWRKYYDWDMIWGWVPKPEYKDAIIQ